MSKAILLSHVFVREDERYKLETIDFCVKHFRKNNPNTKIVISGHGARPYTHTLSMCDDYFWADNIVESDIGVGHPNIVNKGLSILSDSGVSYVMKCRLDSIIARENVVEYCHSIISKEEKRVLITTSNKFDYYMGDLFVYGPTNFIKKCWKEETWFPTTTGLLSMGKNFALCIDSSFPIENFNFQKWDNLLQQEASYRSPESIRWVDLRKHFNKLTDKNRVIDNKFDWRPLVWNDWPKEKRYTEEDFYNDSKQKI